LLLLLILPHHHFLQNDRIFDNYKVGFLNYNTLINAWQNFSKDNKDFKIPKKPEIIVSNLEFVIRNSKNSDNYDKIVLLPSLNTYRFVKSYVTASLQDKASLASWILNRSVSLKTSCYRLFWSLTSRQPASW